jgi:hypothetical protein
LLVEFTNNTLSTINVFSTIGGKELIRHYQRIIAVLCETERIMKEIDVNLQTFE